MEPIVVKMTNQYGPLKAAEVFEHHGWFMPAYVPLGFLGRLAFDLDHEQSRYKRRRLLREALVATYDEEHLAAMLLDLYARVPFLRDRLRSISEAFEAYALGINGAAIVALLPVVEDVLRQHGGGGPRDTGRRKLLGWIDDAISMERARGDEDHNDERVAMLRSFRGFVDQRLYAPSAKCKDAGFLNRNGILHGVFPDDEYRDAHNFPRLVSVLDLLCFTVTVQRGARASALGPKLNAASHHLAAYYRQLRAIAETRPTGPSAPDTEGTDRRGSR